MTDLAANGGAPTLPAHGVSLGEAFRVWLRVAAMSFGGPAGQIAVMHRIIVDEKKWIGESRFLHALSYCMLLPGPEAHQLTIYIGWLMHRWPGAIVAGGLFVVPGIVSIMALSYVYAAFGSVPAVAALFFGLKAAVLAIVLQAVHRVGSRALKSGPMLVLAGLAFIGIFFIGVPFPLIVLAAAIIGFLGARSGSTAFQVGGDHGSGKQGVADSESLLGEELPEHAHPTVERALRVSAIWLSLWLLPVIAIVAVLGTDDTFAAIGGFFSKMAVVTFGGAYAVLAYMAQQAVETYGWLKPGEMLDGLGMAETTPGPLIMVVQFVGFLAAYRHPGILPPMLAGTLGGLLATWCTFVPCFLWIGLGAPFIERLRDNKPLAGALAGITAAVVGVILNLAIWFALHTIFSDTVPVGGYGFGFDMPVLASLRPWALVLSLAALVAIFRFKAGTMQVLAAWSLAGILLYLLGLVAPPAAAQERASRIDIAAMPAGAPPPGFAFARTGSGAAAEWRVVADPTAGAAKAIAQTSTDTTDYRFPLAIYQAVTAKNVDVVVHCKPVAGKIDQACGIAIRLAGPDDYYVARANALEDNVRFYRVVKGRRQELKGANLKVSTNQWHTLGLRAEGQHFTVSFDGRTLFAADDKTFAEPGRVALWTKADSVTHFDAISITPLD